MAGSPPNFHKMDSRSACIQGVLKVKVKGHVIRALSWILGMSYSVIDGLVDSLNDEMRLSNDSDAMWSGWGIISIWPMYSCARALTYLHRITSVLCD